jgi:transcriptional regulator with XRE-family HTH domain
MNKLQQVRERKGFTKKQLCEVSGVSVPMISLIEKGYKDYKRATIWKLANALGVDAKDIEEE